MKTRLTIVAVILICTVVAALGSSAIAGHPVEMGVLDALRQQEYTSIFNSQSPDWNWRTQVGGGTGPAEIVGVVTTYPNGDELVEIEFANDPTLYRVLVHPNGTVTTTGTGLDGKPMCECVEGDCQEVFSWSENGVKCGAYVQVDPQGKKFVVCFLDDPICDDED